MHDERVRRDGVYVYARARSKSVPVLAYVEAALRRGGRIKPTRVDGTQKDTDAKIEAFKTDERDVLLMSKSAFATGLNLYCASRVMLLDAEWNPQRDEQAVARAWRFGQTRSVFV
jgi:SNF2 family DNA or RNA helicase